MEGTAYTWDQTVEKPNEGQGFVLLPEGDYPFEVKEITKSRHEGSAKVPPCNKAIVTFVVDGGELGTASLKENFLLHSSCDWRLCDLFKGLGHRKSGEPLRMDWRRVPGARGICHIKQRQYKKKDGTTGETNDIAYFLDPSGPPAATTTPPAVPASPPPVAAPVEEEQDALPF